ncbi:MAG: FliG C-terminal domain-containing protein, partial [Rickettsiales bacterium]
LLRAIEKEKLIAALKGASENLRGVFFENMSERAEKIIQEDLAAMGPIRLREVDAAQAEIVALAKDLAAKGEITFSGGATDDELIY